MAVRCTHGAGREVQQHSLTACRLMPDPSGQEAEGLLELQTFGTLTRAWLALAAWRTAAGVPHVAMESTGADGQPVSHLLEGTWTVLVVNAAHVHKVPGRQTATAEARWLATLVRYGWLQARGMPPGGQRERRERRRERTTLVQERCRAVNRVQGVRARANMQLASVASAMMGVSGRARLEAWRAGRADPAAMAEWARGRMRSKIALRAQALPGVVRDQHQRVLATQWAHMACLDEPLEALRHARGDRLRARALDPPPVRPAPPPEDARASRAPATPAPVTVTRAVVLVDTMPGVDQRGAERRGAARGLDRARLGPAPRLAAWAGVAPGHDERAGKQRAGTTRHGPTPVRAGWTPLAHAAARTKGTSWSALSHRLAARRGTKRARMAVAHSMVVRVFPLLSRNAP